MKLMLVIQWNMRIVDVPVNGVFSLLLLKSKIATATEIITLLLMGEKSLKIIIC